MAGRRPARSSIAVVASIAVAAVAGLLVTAAALDDDGRKSTTTTTSSSTSTARHTTTTVEQAFPSGEEWSITSALELPATLTTTSAPAPPTTTVEGPPPASPPAPGQYVYAETIDGETAERVYRIEDRPPAEGEQRVPGELQFLVTLQIEGGGVTTITSWRPETVLAIQTIFRLPDVEGSCDWNPDLAQLLLPLAVDATWTYATSCTADFGSQQVTIDRTGEFRVVADERLTVADQGAAVWRIESKETTRFGGGLERTDQEIRTWWFAPKYGLTVREDAQVRRQTREGATDVTIHRQLVALRPV